MEGGLRHSPQKQANVHCFIRSPFWLTLALQSLSYHQCDMWHLVGPRKVRQMKERQAKDFSASGAERSPVGVGGTERRSFWEPGMRVIHWLESQGFPRTSWSLYPSLLPAGRDDSTWTQERLAEGMCVSVFLKSGSLEMYSLGTSLPPFCPH